MSKTSADLYFKTTFPLDVYPKLSGFAPIEKEKVLTGKTDDCVAFYWDNLCLGIDILITRLLPSLPKTTAKDEATYFRSLVSLIYEANGRNCLMTKWSSWPSVALETCVTNCVLGSQVLGVVLASQGFMVEYGLPGPLSHAVVFVRASDGEKFYLDTANNYVVKVAEELLVDGINAYRLGISAGSNFPFRMVPVVSLERSVLSTVNNLSPLLNSAINSGDAEAQCLVERFGLDRNIDYGEWALDQFGPELRIIFNSKIWLEEKKLSGGRISGGAKIK